MPFEVQECAFNARLLVCRPSLTLKAGLPLSSKALLGTYMLPTAADSTSIHRSRPLSLPCFGAGGLRCVLVALEARLWRRPMPGQRYRMQKQSPKKHACTHSAMCSEDAAFWREYTLVLLYIRAKLSTRLLPSMRLSCLCRQWQPEQKSCVFVGTLGTRVGTV